MLLCHIQGWTATSDVIQGFRLQVLRHANHAGAPHREADLGQDDPDLLVATLQAGILQAGTQQGGAQNTLTAAAA